MLGSNAVTVHCPESWSWGESINIPYQAIYDTVNADLEWMTILKSQLDKSKKKKKVRNYLVNLSPTTASSIQYRVKYE